jgi:uncharacterized membrane protein YgcG
MRLLSRCVLWVCVSLPVATAACAGDRQEPLRELPPLLRAVSDEPGMLSVAEGRALSRHIAELFKITTDFEEEIERTTGVKLVTLVVVTVAPESVEAYVQRLIDHWTRQSRALDNGRFVFVVIAKNDRELRIVPGPGLAWMLKPLSGSELTENVPALLRQDQYYEALLTIVNRVSRLITNRQRAVQLDKVFNEPGHGTREEQGWA